MLNTDTRIQKKYNVRIDAKIFRNNVKLQNLSFLSDSDRAKVIIDTNSKIARQETMVAVEKKLTGGQKSLGLFKPSYASQVVPCVHTQNLLLSAR